MKRSPLVRKSGLARTAPPRGTARTAKKRPVATASGGFDPGVRDLLYLRSVGLCEACGLPLHRRDMDAHHRKRRALGDHSLGNGAALHGACHTVAPRSVHQRPLWATERGLIVATGLVAAEVALTLPTGRVVWLHPDLPMYLDSP